jgi:hypothetical protein
MRLFSHQDAPPPGWGSKTYYSQLRIDPLPLESVDELLRAWSSFARR